VHFDPSSPFLFLLKAYYLPPLRKGSILLTLSPLYRRLRTSNPEARLSLGTGRVNDPDFHREAYLPV